MLDTGFSAAFVDVPVAVGSPQAIPQPETNILDDARARDVIRHMARRLVRSQEFSGSDRDDIEQDLAIEVLKRAPQYQPERASPLTFVSRIVDSAAVSMIRHRRRRKRSPGYQLRSLAGPVNDEVSTSLASSISTDDRGRHLQLDIASDQDQLIMREAAAHAIATCDEQLQLLAANLERGTVASVAREMGLSRHKRRALLETSRPAFKRAGFGNSSK